MTPIWKNFHSRSEGSRNRRRIEITKIGETIWLKAYPFRPIPVFRYEDADPLETGKVIHFRDCIGKTPTQIGLDKYDYPEPEPTFTLSPTPGSKPSSTPKAEKTPGFEILATLAGLGGAFYALNKKRN